MKWGRSYSRNWHICSGNGGGHSGIDEKTSLAYVFCLVCFFFPITKESLNRMFALHPHIHTASWKWKSPGEKGGQKRSRNQKFLDVLCTKTSSCTYLTSSKCKWPSLDGENIHIHTQRGISSKQSWRQRKDIVPGGSTEGSLHVVLGAKASTTLSLEMERKKRTRLKDKEE